MFVALGATFHARGSGGTRTIAASDFFTGLFETALGDKELLTAVEVPVEGAGTGSAYAKLFNPASRYAMVGACAQVSVAGGSVASCRVAVGGLTPNARLLESVGAALSGQAPTDDAIQAAARHAVDEVGDEVMGDIHASADYRRRVLPVFVARALTSAVQRAG